MRRAFRNAAIAATGLVAVLIFTGCGVTIHSSIKEQAAFKTECEKAGGEVGYNGFNEMLCSFEEER